MKIFFTGGTSFSGLWFVKELSKQGHEIIAFVQREKEAYEGGRKERLLQLEQYATLHFNCPFGSENFFKVIDEHTSCDIFCHHAADVTDYKSPHFNAVNALQKNTYQLPKLLEKLISKGCNKMILTGSIFEPHEGTGSDELRAVSPYGLSKGLTSEYFSYYAKIFGVALKKFVIPNPFGPHEEFRFTTFLVKTWLEDKVAPISHPNYVRDNIPVTLLAKAYADFVKNDDTKINPSFYVESQGEFTKRFSQAMQSRLQKPCTFEIKEQLDFSEPKVRFNFDKLDPVQLDWSEEKAWDELADFYKVHYAR